MNQTTENKLIGEGVGFERIRRITGYLVGTLDRFNNAKRAEEHDRTKHSVGTQHVDNVDNVDDPDSGELAEESRIA